VIEEIKLLFFRVMEFQQRFAELIGPLKAIEVYIKKELIQDLQYLLSEASKVFLKARGRRGFVSKGT
jgi:hypothetical protein